MTVLHYIPSIDESSGGVGAYMQLLTRDLGKLCELHIVTHKGNNERVLENCTIHYMPYKWKPWNNCKKEFISLLNAIKPDVFHTNCCWMPVSALTAMWASELRAENSMWKNLKIVYTPHGMLEPYSIKRHYWTRKFPAIHLFQKKGLRVCDLIHATAENEKKNLLNLGWNRNIHVIANCVQINEIEIKASWKRTKNILFLSRLHPKKGVNFLIEAVSRLKKDLKGYTITIAGPGEDTYINELKLLSKSCGVDDLVDFIGPVYAKDKWPLYQKADLFVLPTYSENFGIVVPEALASGTPVITTIGTPWEELNTKHCGWWTSIGTDATVDALKQFLACSENDLELMGRNGRKLVEEKYTSESIARQFNNMYRQLKQNDGTKDRYCALQE